MTLKVPDSIPEGWSLTIRDETESITDVGQLMDRHALIEAFKARYHRDEVSRFEAEWAQRWHEAQIGRLLGDGKPGRPKTDDEKTSGATEVLSKDERYEFRLQAQYRDVLERVHGKRDVKQSSRVAVLRAIKAAIREHTPAEPDLELQDTDQVRHGDFREKLNDLPDGSVDLILTDPPYPKEDLPLYSDLAKHAARLLGPRGVLVTYAGNMFLPEVLTRLGEHLNYGWTFNLNMSRGSQSRILGRHIIQTWKPILVYSVGAYPSGEWQQDTIYGGGRDKSDYEWQQDEYAATELVERFSPAGGLVVDPFLGVGTFGAAAVKLGRRFVGVELDSKRFTTAIKRINNE